MPADRHATKRPPVILLTGASGQVGFELRRELATLGEVIAPTSADLDLSRPQQIRDVVRAIAPSLIVNAAAYTAVDRAESDRERCFAINAHAPEILAEEARVAGAGLLHYSTDYVFDGRKLSPYGESDAPAPLNVYGESKLAGERAIEAVDGAWLVLRTSWVFGARGTNFLTTVLRLARDREELRIVDDQIGSPTWCRSLAIVTGQLLSTLGSADGWADARGIYHVASSDPTSWFDFARAILERDPAPAEHRCRTVIPIPSAEYPTAAARPRSSVLSSSKLRQRFQLQLPSWQSQLDLAMAELQTPILP